MAARQIVVPGAMPSRNANGRALPAKLRFYLPDTTTPTTVYTDNALTVAHAFPIESDSAGRWPAIWADDAYTFRVGWSDQTYDRTIRVFDNVAPADDALLASAVIADAAADAAQVAQDAAETAQAAAEAAQATTEALTAAALQNAIEVGTKAAWAAASIPTTFRTTGLKTTGFAAVGDGGGATYKYSATNPAQTVGKFQSADGAYWYIVGDVERVSAKALGAGLGGTDDASIFTGWFATYNTLHCPAGTYTVTSITLANNKRLTTDGLATIFQQKSGVTAGTRVINITGSNVVFEGGKLRGNISVDTGEQNHGVLVSPSGAAIDNVTIGGLYGQDLRGDVLYVGGTSSYGVSNISFGDVGGDNILRNVVSITGGRCIRGGRITGSRVGLLILDIEPDAANEPVRDVQIASVRGGVVQVAGTSATRQSERIYIGQLDLDPSLQANSSPTYSGYSVANAVTLRNIKSLRIGFLKATGHTGLLINHIWNSGELTAQRLVIDNVEASAIGSAESTYFAYCQCSNLQYLTVGGGSVSLSATNKAFVNGNSATPANSNFDIRDLVIDGLVARDCMYSRFTNIIMSNAATQAFTRVRNSAISGVFNCYAIGYDSYDNVVRGSTITIAVTLWGSFSSSNLHQRNCLQDCTVGGASVDVSEVGKAGITAVGDAAKTLNPYADTVTQRWSTTLTADRSVTLTTTGAKPGTRFLISRPATGAFNLNVGTGPLKALAAGSWCKVEYDGSAWVLTDYGSL